MLELNKVTKIIMLALSLNKQNVSPQNKFDNFFKTFYAIVFSIWATTWMRCSNKEPA